MGFIQDVESIAHKIETGFENFWRNEPSYARVLSTTIKVVGPILETVVTAEGGPLAGAAVTAIIDEVQSDLIAAQNLVAVVGPVPSVQSLLTGASDDLNQLLTAGHIKDATTQANVTLVIKELAALVSAFPTTTTPEPATPVSEPGTPSTQS